MNCAGGEGDLAVEENPPALKSQHGRFHQKGVFCSTVSREVQEAKVVSLKR